MDQAHRIAEILGMDFHFYPALQIEEERYGDAILTSMPMKVVKSGGLSNRSTRTAHEPRGAIWVEISWGETPVQIVNTHLGLWARDRGIQVRALLGEDWLGHPDCRDPLILCGDFNALPRSIAYWKLSRHLRDAQRALPGHRPKATFPGRFPSARIDHVFVGSGLEVLSIEVPKNDLSRLASDHLPLITELRLLKTGP
jgi:endonuclease/exonuclease/phosphatase family metal-dependent hydrolase